ncbi:MAG: L-ribulose-5-phosphate 4-epimerase AraD [Chloroflexota bacterium]
MSTDLRAEVAEANRAIERAGLVTLAFGNASGVDRDAGVLWIKPSGQPCADVRPDDLVAVALDDGRVVEGQARPSSDTPTHRRIYLEFPEIGGVIHTHSASAAAWAQAGRPIPALGTTHADYFRGPVLISRHLVTDEVDGEYEWETGAVIAETIRESGSAPADSPAVLVRAHGPFTWGATPGDAVEAAIALEAIATIAWRTLAIDPATPPISADLLRRHFDRKHGPGAYYGQPSGSPGVGSRRP